MPLPKIVESHCEWRRADWYRYQSDRISRVWEVVALSMGIEPMASQVNAARRNDEFKEEYELRIKTLTRMMSTTDVREHVTYFPDHPYAARAKKTRDHAVDVVTCIDKLTALKGLELPNEFVKLRETLIKLPVPPPPDHRPTFILAPQLPPTGAPQHQVPIQIDQPVPKKRDQSKANETKAADRHDLLIYALVKVHCEYSGNASDKEKTEKIAEIVEQIEHARYGKFGIGKDALKSILDRAYTTIRGMGLPP